MLCQDFKVKILEEERGALHGKSISRSMSAEGTGRETVPGWLSWQLCGVRANPNSQPAKQSNLDSLKVKLREISLGGHWY
jgi:hypothetical protein